MYIPHFVYPFIHQWTFGLLPPFCGGWCTRRGLRDLSSRPGIEPASPALGAQSLNHWTAREVPDSTVWWNSKLWIMLLWTWVYKYLFRTFLAVLLGVLPRSGIAGSFDSFIFNFFRNCFLQWLHHFTFPTNSMQGFQFLCTEPFHFHEVQYVSILSLPVHLVSYPINHCQIQCREVFALCFRSFIVLALTFKSLISIE